MDSTMEHKVYYYTDDKVIEAVYITTKERERFIQKYNDHCEWLNIERQPKVMLNEGGHFLYDNFTDCKNELLDELMDQKKTIQYRINQVRSYNERNIETV